MSPAARRPRRAVRPSGTVGTDESVLRSSVPAVPGPSPQAASHGPGGPVGDGGTRARAAAPAGSDPDEGAPAGAPARPAHPSEDLWRALRSADDADHGWGRPEPSSNDERLLREKPPHW